MAEKTPESKKSKSSKKSSKRKVPIEIVPSNVNESKKISPSSSKKTAEDIKSLHAQLASDIDVESIEAELKNQNVITDANFDTLSDSRFAAAKSFVVWDEVEMKKHGLVDSHAHHQMAARFLICERCKQTRLPERVVWMKDARISDAGGLIEHCIHGHVPFDEVAMKNAGFVDDHCRRLTENEVDTKPPSPNQSSKHIHFDTSSVDVFESPTNISSSVSPNQSRNQSVEADEIFLTLDDNRKEETRDTTKIKSAASSSKATKQKSSYKKEERVGKQKTWTCLGNSRKKFLKGVLAIKGKISIKVNR